MTGVETQVFLLIKKYLENHSDITTTVAAKLISKSAPTTLKHLAQLAKLGLLNSDGSNKNRRYSLNK